MDSRAPCAGLAPQEIKATLINPFAVIPAKAGIQLPVELKTLDSGSPLRYARNDYLFSASLTLTILIMSPVEPPNKTGVI